MAKQNLKRKQTTAYFEESLHDAIKEDAAAEGISMAAWFRTACRERLARRIQVRKRGAPLTEVLRDTT